MKLYNFDLAPGPRRVRMFLAEKGVDVPMVETNVRERAQFEPEFVAKNPWTTIPLLELDDGTCIAETVAICRYIEECHPEPPLMGHDSLSRALVEMWNRRVEITGYLSVADMVRNSAPMFADRALPGISSGVPQIPALVERGRFATARFLELVDQQLADNTYIAGDSFSIADITAFVTVELAKRGDMSIPPERLHVIRWYDQVSQRPSASA